MLFLNFKSVEIRFSFKNIEIKIEQLFLFIFNELVLIVIF